MFRFHSPRHDLRRKETSGRNLAFPAYGLTFTIYSTWSRQQLYLHLYLWRPKMRSGFPKRVPVSYLFLFLFNLDLNIEACLWLGISW